MAGPDTDRVLEEIRARLAEYEAGVAGSDPATGTDPEDGPDADAEAVARNIVLRQLTGQARSRNELAKTLVRRQVPQEAADAVLARMTEVGLIDDAAFAADWVRSRQHRRHLSKSALRRELHGKGIDSEVVEQAVGEVDAETEYDAAVDLARRKARSMVGLDRNTAWRRLSGVLGRRGFGTALIVRVVDEVLSRDADATA